MNQSVQKTVSWESRLNPELPFRDMDEELLSNILKEGLSQKSMTLGTLASRDPSGVMQKLGVVDQNGVLRNAANVLLGRRPADFHNQCCLHLARFRGKDRRAFLDKEVCMGNLFEQYETAIRFCLKHLNVRGETQGDFVLGIPLELIREAVLNMLVHRSWDSANMVPNIAIYDDRIVFQNPGRFPVGAQWQDFAEGRVCTMPANPIIAAAFYHRGLTEAWGRGIAVIADCCREAGLPEPEFCEVASVVSLTIRFAKPLENGIS